MLVLRAGLALAGLAFLGVAGLSLGAGLPPDVAILRGLACFAVVTVLGYVGELIVATAPLPTAETAAPQPRAVRASAIAPAREPGTTAAAALTTEAAIQPGTSIAVDDGTLQAA